MYTPNTLTFIGGVPIAGIDLSLNTFLGITWDILLPYTLLGVALMVYSHSRLMSGERDLRRQAKLDLAADAEEAKAFLA